MKSKEVARPKLLTVEEAAEALGLKVCTIRYWVLTRQIPYRKIGGRAVRIAQSDIDEILSKSLIPARTA